MSSLEAIAANLAVSLPPGSLRNFKESVETVLSGLMLKYNKDLGGVLMSFENLRVPEGVGYIIDELPFIRVHVQFEGILFNPAIGNVLVGVVNKIGTDHVGMLVHGMFNASVARGKRLKKVAIGSAVTFAVTSLYEARGMLSLEGDLISVASPEKEEE